MAKIRTIYISRWSWRPANLGSYYLHWTCDIGGDTRDFYRNFSVIDNSYAVMIIGDTNMLDAHTYLHQLHVPFSFWYEDTLYTRCSFAQAFTCDSQPSREYGDEATMFIYSSPDYEPNDAGLPSDEQTIFYNEGSDVQNEVLRDYKLLWQMQGFTEPLTNFYCYGFSNANIALARSLGYGQIGALCADQNWSDGGTEFNHWGCPARPLLYCHG